MKKEVLYEVKAIYRDDFRVTGYTFGEGEKALCIIGSMRGNENQQLYCCARLVSRLKQLEEDGALMPGKKILVIPCANPYSINTKKRFWCTDNTDINRMFPGYDLGETTQRIAAGIFEHVKGWQYGIQFASFYMPGAFIPHVRMMETGYQNTDLACDFGLPYVVVHHTRPFDTTTLNYNWQIWGTQAFSLYTTNTARVDEESALQSEEAVLNFMARQGLIHYHARGGYRSEVIHSSDFVSIRTEAAGFLKCFVKPGQRVTRGQPLARILDPYDLSIRAELKAPVNGVVAFAGDEPMTYANTAVLKLIREDE
ncbi:MAG: M14 family metallopeptidase [Clostridia bacterium]|nr:M14 family metallopeptidase [Clostridia bacterium]